MRYHVTLDGARWTVERRENGERVSRRVTRFPSARRAVKAIDRRAILPGEWPAHESKASRAAQAETMELVAAGLDALDVADPDALADHNEEEGWRD